jgi:hypothetical protein
MNLRAPLGGPFKAVPQAHPLLSLFREGDSGGVWLPSSIDGSDNDPVAEWLDSKFDIPVAQSVDGRKPRLRIDGAYRWLEFDIDDLDEADVLGDCLLGEFAISTAALTIIVAAHNEDDRALGSTADDNDFNCRTVCLKVPAAGGSERDLNIHHNRPKFDGETGLNYGAAGVRHPQNAAVNLTPAANAALATPGVVTYQRNGTAIQDARVDGEAVTRVTTTTTTFESTHLGIGYGLTTSLAFNTTGVGHHIGKIAGIFIIDRVLFASERLSAEAYMAGLLPPGE